MYFSQKVLYFSFYCAVVSLNEHTNGLIRQYLPKKSEFLNVSKDEIIMIENRLNHRPRKILNYKTPYEVFFSEMSRRLAS